eukprot:SAG31_NODE_1341_length_8708_cov_10.945174_5_plen_70_part_00
MLKPIGGRNARPLLSPLAESMKQHPHARATMQGTASRFISILCLLDRLDRLDQRSAHCGRAGGGLWSKL